jgi:hypothetical protein
VKRHRSHSSATEQLHTVTTEPPVTELSILSDAAEVHSEHSIAQQQDEVLTSYSPYDLQRSPANHSSISSASSHLSHSSHHSHASINSVDLIPAEIPQIYFDEQEACLMRYFVVQLGHWVSNYAGTIIQMSID